MPSMFAFQAWGSEFDAPEPIENQSSMVESACHVGSVTCWPANLAYLSKLSANERLCLNKRWTVTEEW